MKRFHYTESQGMAGIPGMLPFVSATLLRINTAQSITHRRTLPVLVDSGSTVNVLPFDIGESLGFHWENCPETPFIGRVRGVPALGVDLFVKVAGFPPKRFAFGWSAKPSTDMPCIFGQTNFFDEFYVDFRKPLGYFEIALKAE
jgi:hypothetical protein